MTADGYYSGWQLRGLSHLRRVILDSVEQSHAGSPPTSHAHRDVVGVGEPIAEVFGLSRRRMLGSIVACTSALDTMEMILDCSPERRLRPNGLAAVVRSIAEAAALACWLSDRTVTREIRARRALGFEQWDLRESKKYFDAVKGHMDLPAALEADARADFAGREMLIGDSRANGFQPLEFRLTDIVTSYLGRASDYRLLSGAAHSFPWATTTLQQLTEPCAEAVRWDFAAQAVASARVATQAVVAYIDHRKSGVVAMQMSNTIRRAGLHQMPAELVASLADRFPVLSKEHTRVCPRCGTEFPIAELCPLCYGWEKPAGTPTSR